MRVRKAAVGIAVTMFAAALTACREAAEVTCDSLLAEYAQQTANYQSVSMVMTTETNTTLRSQGAENVKVHSVVTTNADAVGKDVHIKNSTRSESADGDAPSDGAPQEYYYMYDEAASERTGYRCDWERSEICKLHDPEVVFPTDALDLKTYITDRRLNAATANFDGTECYEIDGRMTWDAFRSTLGAQAVLAVPDIEEGTVLNDVVFDVSIFFTKEEHKLIAMTIDALSPLNTVLGRSSGTDTVSIEKALVTVTDVQYNTGKTIALPSSLKVVEE